jgi:hypothetical protein
MAKRKGPAFRKDFQAFATKSRWATIGAPPKLVFNLTTSIDKDGNCIITTVMSPKFLDHFLKRLLQAKGDPQ